MKDVYFQMSDFEGKMLDMNEFQDFGYVPELLDKTREFFEKLGQPNGEEHMRQCGIDVDFLKANSGGHHLRVTNYPTNGSKTSWIYYNKFDDESTNILVRVHEEVHAICHLGLRREFERKMGLPNLSSLYEGDFCVQLGLYVLRRKGIKPHPDILVSCGNRNAVN